MFIQSDLVIVPTKPSIADVLAIERTIVLFEQAQYKNREVKGRILFNMVDSRTNMLTNIEEEVKKFNIPVMKTKIESRVSYTRTLLEDKGIFSENAPLAHQEINNLAEEVIKIINN